MDVVCPYCGKAPESLLHALWLYRSLDVLWMVILWRVWFRCNKLVHGEAGLIAADIVSWSICFIEEVDSAQPTMVRSNFASAARCWQPPGERFYKLNVDTSIKSSYCWVGLGAVVRDYKGLFMAGLSRKLVGSVSIEIAEASAILNGFQLAFDSGFSSLLVESDALSVVNYLLNGNPPNSKVGLIISDILMLCSRASVSLSFVPRSANSLARYSFRIDNVAIWLEDAPP
ncbi:hypothetical protein ACOSQ3_010913 [Xanthoceras sorbifolium]